MAGCDPLHDPYVFGLACSALRQQNPRHRRDCGHVLGGRFPQRKLEWLHQHAIQRQSSIHENPVSVAAGNVWELEPTIGSERCADVPWRAVLHQNPWRARSTKWVHVLSKCVTRSTRVSCRAFVPDFFQVTGSHARFCPRLCSNTCRWIRLSTHRHRDHIQYVAFRHSECAVRDCMRHFHLQPPHVCHRQGTGLSPEARTCGGTLSFLGRSRLGALDPIVWTDQRRNQDSKQSR